MRATESDITWDVGLNSVMWPIYQLSALFAFLQFCLLVIGKLVAFKEDKNFPIVIRIYLELINF